MTPTGCGPAGGWPSRRNAGTGWTSTSSGALAALPGFHRDERAAHFEHMVTVYERARADRCETHSKLATYAGEPLGQWLHDLARGRITIDAQRAATALPVFW